VPVLHRLSACGLWLSTHMFRNPLHPKVTTALKRDGPGFVLGGYKGNPNALRCSLFS
jgi:hypothetical protein